MKTCIVWILVIVATAGIAVLAYWLTTILSFMQSYYITIVLNLVVDVYIVWQEYK